MTLSLIDVSCKDDMLEMSAAFLLSLWTKAEREAAIHAFLYARQLFQQTVRCRRVGDGIRRDR